MSRARAGATIPAVADITVRHVTVHYGDFAATHGVTLHVEEGEFLVVVGASGCGKTTMLRAIAGLEQPVAGEIEIGGEAVFSEPRQIDVAPARRRVGMVFQSYALYPHMTVEQNVAFPLRTQRVGRGRIGRAVRQALDVVELAGMERRYPRELSGGQQQRVAIARALVRQPHVLLLDEPLSNVDPKLRAQLRTELKQLHRRIGSTTLYVTHDVAEAMALADRVAAMFGGEIHQVGRPADLYRTPATVPVAALFGAHGGALLRGRVVALPDGGLALHPDGSASPAVPLSPDATLFAGQRVVMDVRAEDVTVLGERAHAPGAPAGAVVGDEPAARHAGRRLQAGRMGAPAGGTRVEVAAAQPEGPASVLHLRLDDGPQELVARYAGPQPPRPGQRLTVRVLAGNVYDAGTQRLIARCRSAEPGDRPPPVRGGAPVSSASGARS